jgi:hypothetical protein
MEELSQSASASATQSPPDSATQSPPTLSASVDRALELHSAAQALTELRNTLRINPLMDIIERGLRTMPREELYGAQFVLGSLALYLQGQCVESQEPAFSKTKLVKTLEELFEIATEISINNGCDTDSDSE